MFSKANYLLIFSPLSCFMLDIIKRQMQFVKDNLSLSKVS